MTNRPRKGDAKWEAIAAADARLCAEREEYFSVLKLHGAELEALRLSRVHAAEGGGVNGGGKTPEGSGRGTGDKFPPKKRTKTNNGRREEGLGQASVCPVAAPLLVGKALRGSVEEKAPLPKHAEGEEQTPSVYPVAAPLLVGKALRGSVEEIALLPKHAEEGDAMGVQQVRAGGEVDSGVAERMRRRARQRLLRTGRGSAESAWGSGLHRNDRAASVTGEQTEGDLYSSEHAGRVEPDVQTVDTLFVGNLSPEVGAPLLRNVFSRFGAVLDVRLVPSRRIAFVQFSEGADVHGAMEELDNVLLNDLCVIRVKPARAPRNPSDVPRVGLHQPADAEADYSARAPYTPLDSEQKPEDGEVLAGSRRAAVSYADIY